MEISLHVTNTFYQDYIQEIFLEVISIESKIIEIVSNKKNRILLRPRDKGLKKRLNFYIKL